MVAMLVINKGYLGISVVTGTLDKLSQRASNRQRAAGSGHSTCLSRYLGCLGGTYRTKVFRCGLAAGGACWAERGLKAAAPQRAAVGVLAGAGTRPSVGRGVCCGNSHVEARCSRREVRLM